MQSTQDARLDQYVIRFPHGMRDRIKALAKANRRSMNAEIIVALDERLAATGEGFADTAPAAAHSTTPVPAGAIINQGCEGASDD